MSQSQYGGSLGGPIVSNRTFYFTNVEQRRLDQSGLVTISADNVARRSTRAWRRPATRARWSRPACTRIPSIRRTSSAKVDHQVNGRDQFGVRYSLYDVSSQNSRGAGGLNAPSASSGTGQPRSDDRGQQHADALGPHGARNARAVRPRRSEGAAHRSDRPGGEHRGRRLVRHAARAARRGA